MSQGLAVVLTHSASPERAGAARSAMTVQSALSQLGWHTKVVDLRRPSAVRHIIEADLAFVAGHGWYSEDGKVQGLLEVMCLPYTGSGVLASATAMHKPTANGVLRHAGLRVPRWRDVDPGDAPAAEAARLVQELGLPLFVKPASGGGSIGSGIARDIDTLIDRLAAEQRQQPRVALMASAYVSGVDTSVGLIELDGRLEMLPILATEHDGEFYDHEIKHDPARRRHRCPADLSVEIAGLVGTMARRAFRALGCHGLGRVDFIVDRDSIPWCLEVNTVPGLSEQGNLATMGRAAGLTYCEMVEAIAATAFSKPFYRP